MPWKEVAFNLIKRLLQVGKFNAIYAQRKGNLYYSHIYYLHRLPDWVTFDQSIRFVNDFWACFTQRLEISLRLFPLTILRQTYKPKIQIRLLSLINKMIGPAGFPVPNFLLTTTRRHLSTIPPFFLNYSYHPAMGIEPPKL